VKVCVCVCVCERVGLLHTLQQDRSQTHRNMKTQTQAESVTHESEASNSRFHQMNSFLLKHLHEAPKHLLH